MKCESCGEVLKLGSWPYCADGTGKHGHEPPHGNLGDFRAYTDYHIADEPVHITSLAQKKTLLKPHWKDDQIIQIQPRDLPDSHYRELNDRRAHRAEMARKEGRI